MKKLLFLLLFAPALTFGQSYNFFFGTDTLQSLNLSGDTLSIVPGNSVVLPSHSPQTLSLVTNTLSISEGNSVDLSGYLDNTDSQSLSISNDTLTISGGNSVVLPAGGGGTSLIDSLPIGNVTIDADSNKFEINELDSLVFTSIQDEFTRASKFVINNKGLKAFFDQQVTDRTTLFELERDGLNLEFEDPSADTYTYLSAGPSGVDLYGENVNGNSSIEVGGGDIEISASDDIYVYAPTVDLYDTQTLIGEYLTSLMLGELSYQTAAPAVASVMEFDASGNASWKATTPLSGSGAPAVAPRYNGDRYFDYTNSKWYSAWDNEDGDGTGDGLDADDWVILN